MNDIDVEVEIAIEQLFIYVEGFSFIVLLWMIIVPLMNIFYEKMRSNLITSSPLEKLLKPNLNFNK